MMKILCLVCLFVASSKASWCTLSGCVEIPSLAFVQHTMTTVDDSNDSTANLGAKGAVQRHTSKRGSKDKDEAASSVHLLQLSSDTTALFLDPSSYFGIE
jgi:hypothetical protein